MLGEYAKCVFNEQSAVRCPCKVKPTETASRPVPSLLLPFVPTLPCIELQAQNSNLENGLHLWLTCRKAAATAEQVLAWRVFSKLQHSSLHKSHKSVILLLSSKPDNIGDFPLNRMLQECKAVCLVEGH